MKNFNLPNFYRLLKQSGNSFTRNLYKNTVETLSSPICYIDRPRIKRVSSSGICERPQVGQWKKGFKNKKTDIQPSWPAWKDYCGLPRLKQGQCFLSHITTQAPDEK